MPEHEQIPPEAFHLATVFLYWPLPHPRVQGPASVDSEARPARLSQSPPPRRRPAGKRKRDWATSVKARGIAYLHWKWPKGSPISWKCWHNFYRTEYLHIESVLFSECVARYWSQLRWEKIASPHRLSYQFLLQRLRDATIGVVGWQIALIYSFYESKETSLCHPTDPATPKASSSHSDASVASSAQQSQHLLCRLSLQKDHSHHCPLSCQNTSRSSSRSNISLYPFSIPILKSQQNKFD